MYLHLKYVESILANAPTLTRHYSGLSFSEREEIGRKVKHLINVGRKKFLQEQGFRASLFVYTQSSLENIALLALP